MNVLTKKQKKLKQLNDWKNSPIAKESSEYRPKKVTFDPVISFLNACLDFDKDEIEQMLADGININCCDDDDLTALHQACINSNIELVEFLLMKNADINVLDRENWTPLHISCKIGEYELTRLLIAKGAALDIPNCDGELPYHLVEEDKKDLKKFVGDEIKKRKIDIKKVVEMESSMMLQDIMNWKRMGKYDPPIDKVNKSTPLHVAASKNYTNVITELLPLLSQSQIDAQDIDGWTALHAAAHWGHFDVCSLLMKAGANYKIKTFSQETIYSLVDNENKEVFEMKMDEIIKAVENNKKFDGLFPQPALRGDGNARRKSSIMRQSLELKKSAQMKEPQLERKALSVLYDHKEIDDETAEENDAIDDSDKELLEKSRYNNRLNDLDLSFINMNVRGRKANRSAETPFDNVPDTDEVNNQPKNRYETKESNIVSENKTKVNSLIDSSHSQKSVGTASFCDQSQQTRSLSCSVSSTSRDNASRMASLGTPVGTMTETIKTGNIRTAQELLNDNKSKTEAIIPPKISTDSNDSDVDSYNNTDCTNKSENDLEKYNDDTSEDVQLRSQRASLAMPPGKVEQAEVERRETARRVRSSRRSTQGITGDEIKSVEKKFDTMKTVTENENKPLEQEIPKNIPTLINRNSDKQSMKDNNKATQLDATDSSLTSISTSVSSNKVQRHSSLTHASARSNIMSFLGNKMPQRPLSQFQTKPSTFTESEIKPMKVIQTETPNQKNQELVTSTPNNDKRSLSTANVPLAKPEEIIPFAPSHNLKLSDGNYIAKHVTGSTSCTKETASSSRDFPGAISMSSRITTTMGSNSDFNKPQSDSQLSPSSPIVSISSKNDETDEYSVLPKKISKKLIDDELEKKGLLERIKELEAHNQLLRDELKATRSQSNEDENKRKTNDENRVDDEKYNLKNEVERYRNENRTLRSRQEALLRVINKIQSELETVHTINHNHERLNPS